MKPEIPWVMSESQRAPYPHIHPDKLNVVSIIHLSSIKYSSDHNKTAACLFEKCVPFYYHKLKYQLEQ